ncbi:double-stranded RNA-binding protein Staufen homolog 2 [Ixodes scapularis]|uniref:double-stranded RNA-binding protein Staufen homolog 2 n=1 Tax=Ixodes scapularis TaxID=6945 RepID=UPI001A9E5889|nr:double-stranded RNA-binding protein Staufen homolog 2 [Ixodes scapularis]
MLSPSPGGECAPPGPDSAPGDQPTAAVANSKEKKTPMCLVNELARFNKVALQYRLVEESGPPHKKNFTVVLRLAGNEEYQASGTSIKRAQHAAAQRALEETSLPRPVARPANHAQAPLTPTVELNALAMKRGELATYRVVELPQLAYLPPLNFQGMYPPRYRPLGPVPTSFSASLEVGSRRFHGEGPTEQAARHAAAQQALSLLRGLPPRPPPDPVPADLGEAPGDQLKSPVSLVHELALKRGLSVSFQVVQESGPPHMRTFRTLCTVGELSAEGEGNGKKASKKRAAQGLLEQLRQLPPLEPPAGALPPPGTLLRRRAPPKKRARNLVREQRVAPTPCEVNPISRLIQIQQAKKEPEPSYSLVSERGDPRQREFVLQCVLGALTTQGAGPNKKTAKRLAAEAMLQKLGYSRPPQGPQPQGQSPTPSSGGEAPVRPEEVPPNPRGGRQLVPGLLLVPATNQGLGTASDGGESAGDLQASSAIAKELLDQGVSPTAEALRQAAPLTVAPVRPKQQLLYLAEVLGFQVHFTDFPKGNKRDFLSLVTLTTCPPQVSHGAGSSLEASHDEAALAVLRTLARRGLDALGQPAKEQQEPLRLRQ